ncbi:MAG: radical SAM protein [Verrucomicrobia bacterium]|jgi:MoaA/NifB/PqqE/SkfB family radical SAM enzyme|nr:radical SAM protein [Verrucomicrobiota bacterium]
MEGVPRGIWLVGIQAAAKAKASRKAVKYGTEEKRKTVKVATEGPSQSTGLPRPCASDRVDTIDRAVFIKRFWLKISHVCNNNCLFCLDAERLPSRCFEPTALLATTILEAHNSGHERLILSGGEPTIHPQFVDIVRYAFKVGFPQIQTITNGRMLSYPSFAESVVRAGLSEATFSVHGHTPELHDRLTGVEGSFDQAVRGIRNVQDIGGCIVNADIVVNKQNYAHIADIIAFFSSLGVYEYDLLHVIPFGRAFPNRRRLFFGMEEAYEDIQRALAFSRRQRTPYHIWTNRFPHGYLENYEELIQDPHKLHDEVRGRRDQFDRVLQGHRMRCYPDRCQTCFLNAFCGKLSFYLDVMAGRQTPHRVSASSLDGEICEFMERACRFDTLRLPLTQATDRLLKGSLAAHGKLRQIELTCEKPEDVSGTDMCMSGSTRVLCEIGEASEAMFEPTFWSSGVQCVIIPLGKRNSEFILAHAADIRNIQDRLEFRIPTFGRLSEARAQSSLLGQVLRQFTGSVYHGCAPCLAPSGLAPCDRRVNLDLLFSPGRLDIEELLADFILNDYYIHRRTCSGCAHWGRCPGMHINFIRLFGFKTLTPVCRE